MHLLMHYLPNNQRVGELVHANACEVDTTTARLTLLKSNRVTLSGGSNSVLLSKLVAVSD